MTTPLGADVYVIYQGVLDAWKLTTGFDERKIEDAHKKGFDIALSLMLEGYSNTEYLKHIEDIITKYNVKFINVKEAFNNESSSLMAKKNYEALCEIIDKKDFTINNDTSIECEGENFNKFGSVRDKFRLHKELLESLGWKSLHVCACEWIENKSDYQKPRNMSSP